MITLSYPLSNKTPMYGGGAPPKLIYDKKILNGDSCNTLDLILTSHSGTHIDFPYHFDQKGKTLSDYPPDFFYVSKIKTIFLEGSVSNGDLIGIEDFEREGFLENSMNDIQAILIKTGFCKKRSLNVYWEEPPGIDPNLPDFLRNNFPKLRFVGMDLISVSSYVNRAEGREAHKAFLKHKDPILPIEDMDLNYLPKEISNMIVSPLNIKNGDGSPCCIFVNIKIENN